jgi:hypothetical protein
MRQPVLLPASQRLTRAQAFIKGAHNSAHFHILSLCAAGRDEGSFRFEADHFVEQIGFYARLRRAVAQLGHDLNGVRIAVTDFTGGRLTATLDDQV